jgi:hypothetical protein
MAAEALRWGPASWWPAPRLASRLFVGAATILALMGAGPEPLPLTDYTGTGVVVALLPPPSDLHATRPVIVIRHEPIPGLMNEAMSMPFIAASTVLFRGLRPGDRVVFGLQDTPGALLVVWLRRRGTKD